MLTKYGYSTVGTIVIVVFIIISISLFVNNSYIKIALVAIGVLLLAFTLYFFRDPNRKVPNKQNIIVSPADGKILTIKEKFEKNFINENCWEVSIFMSPLNVHVNRIPVSGTVDYLNYHKGEYLVAFHEKADERNERNEIGIQGKNGKVFFTQVAGFIARRIVSTLHKRDSVNIGNRFGMIKFGSRSDVLVPANWKVIVKEGDKVKAGETILFELNGNNN
ncbi:phosphatidylserine decarboxylase [bacterium BMS3Abin04]|nr:phosphatidylserine decarboxylase [bacterium BMS3Abin04]